MNLLNVCVYDHISCNDAQRVLKWKDRCMVNGYMCLLKWRINGLPFIERELLLFSRIQTYDSTMTTTWIECYSGLLCIKIRHFPLQRAARQLSTKYTNTLTHTNTRTYTKLTSEHASQCNRIQQPNEYTCTYDSNIEFYLCIARATATTPTDNNKMRLENIVFMFLLSLRWVLAQWTTHSVVYSAWFQEEAHFNTIKQINKYKN